MAQFVAQCPHCKQQFNAQSEWLGRQTNCPACGMVFTITATAQTPNVMPQPDNGFIAQCPHCKNQFRAQAAWAGQQTNCPSCGNLFIIANSSEKQGFWKIFRDSKTLIPDAVFGGFFLVSFVIYFTWLMLGFFDRYEHSTSFSCVDILWFNFPLGAAGYKIFELRFDTFIDHVLLFVLLGVCVLYLARAILNRTVFQKIQIFASCICLVLVMIVSAIIWYEDLDLYFLRGFDHVSSIWYSLSTLFYVFILSLATVAFSVWMKYKSYLRECSNGEKIGFMDFIKKHLKWKML